MQLIGELVQYITPIKSEFYLCTKREASFVLILLFFACFVLVSPGGGPVTG